jgi:hypothetical protein
MSGGGKGGSSTTEIEIPQWLEDEARRNISIARDVSQTGYVPYYGPEVAALSPMQNAAMIGTNQAAAAFGMPTAQGGMPAPETFAGGVQGYSSGGLYNQSLEALKQQAPAQIDYIQSMFMDPVTGDAARSPFGAPVQPVSPVASPSAGFNRENETKGQDDGIGFSRSAGGRMGNGGGAGAGGGK